ncbi:daptide-type RiPP biosynthesis methyltransferase [Georgenia faecalis]|uniref:Daptide-type RiPP biosynthesis methyltransferase n=1 Tax=Georgenia faecalis TaxID=2483799 RepID=A0ABV9DD32_9MICO|nr:daptide-type RiPP biosynthesis methyltransferase [Georgenia faecalis]
MSAGQVFSMAGVPGLAAEILAPVADRVVLHDLYGEVGAAVYTALAEADQHEVREFVAAVARTPGPVLDLAAGAGRLTLPLLALGRHVTALDLSVPMLAALERALDAAPRAFRARTRVVQGDMSDFTLGEQFAVVVLAATSVTLLDATGRQGLYASVARHLTDGGRFVLSVAQDRRPGEEGEDTCHDIRLPDGRGYRIIEHIARGARQREVTVVPVDLETPEVPVCRSTVEVLSLGDLEDEVAGTGLQVVGVEPTAGALPHRTVLVTLARAR